LKKHAIKHYKKNSYYRRSESVGNGHNPSVMMFYRWTFDDKKFIVDTTLPTNYKHPLVITNGQVRRSCRRLLPTDLAVGNPSVSVKFLFRFICFFNILQYLHIENSNTDKSSSPTFQHSIISNIVSLSNSIIIYIR